MYKDKQISIYEQISRHRLVASILAFSVICLIYSFVKVGTTPSDMRIHKQISHRGIHTGHYSKDIDYSELIEGISEEYKEKCLDILEGKKNINPRAMWSRSFEDWYIYHNFFKDDTYHFTASSNFDEKKDSKHAFGVYLSIGPSKPFEQTSTAFFDVCLGWAGICIWAPDLAVDNFFSSQRSCNTISRECLWNADHSFHRGHSDDSFCRTVDRYIEDVLNEYHFKDRFGNDFGLKEERFEIDFVSLRVSGSEQRFLQCWPFDTIRPKVWSVSTIELAKNTDKLMMAEGYLKFDTLAFDTTEMSMIYVRRDAVYPYTNTTKHFFHRETKCAMVKPQN